MKKAWRTLCKEHHPDVEGGDDAEFRRITHAYNMLTNPKYRYEQEHKTSPLDLDIRMQVAVSFEQAFYGHKIILNFAKLEMDDAGKLIHPDKMEIESLIVDVAPGSMGGGDMAFSAKGIKRGDNRGNVIVMVAVQPHPKFRADQQGNILAQEKIPLDTMVKGGAFEVQTMYGLRTIKIKPGSRPGENIAIKKLGCHGQDHIVQIDALYPTAEQLKGEAWKGLDINWALDEEIRKQQEEDMMNQARFFSSGTFRFSSSSATGGF